MLILVFCYNSFFSTFLVMLFLYQKNIVVHLLVCFNRSFCWRSSRFFKVVTSVHRIRNFFLFCRKTIFLEIVFVLKKIICFFLFLILYNLSVV